MRLCLKESVGGGLARRPLGSGGTLSLLSQLPRATLSTRIHPCVAYRVGMVPESQQQQQQSRVEMQPLARGREHPMGCEAGVTKEDYGDRQWVGAFPDQRCFLILGGCHPGWAILVPSKKG